MSRRTRQERERRKRMTDEQNAKATRPEPIALTPVVTLGAPRATSQPVAIIRTSKAMTTNPEFVSALGRL